MSRVGQFLGKLFAGQTDKNETILRAYGKLPLYAEYRRLEVAPGTSTSFSRWLDEGRLAWVRSKPEKERGSTRNTRVVFRWPDSRDIVLASIWDSRDSLGRIFPFVFFTVCPRESLGEHRLQRWAACLAMHERFSKSHARLAVLSSGGDFYRLYNKQIFPIRPDDVAKRAASLLEETRKITLEDWFEAAPLGDIKPGEWFASLLRRMERWKTQPESVKQLALSCPLAAGIPCDVQAVIWLEWVATLPGVDHIEPWLVLPPADAPAPRHMQVIFRDLIPEDFQLLTTDADTYGYVEDLAQMPSGATENSEDGPATAMPSGSMLDALTRHTAG
ncbi:MAG: hypothetical protein ABIG44_02250 [Planctomycetota bacterium]